MLAVVACCDELAAHRYALLLQIGGTAQVGGVSLLAFSSSRQRTTQRSSRKQHAHDFPIQSNNESYFKAAFFIVSPVQLQERKKEKMAGMQSNTFLWMTNTWPCRSRIEEV